MALYVSSALCAEPIAPTSRASPTPSLIDLRPINPDGMPFSTNSSPNANVCSGRGLAALSSASLFSLAASKSSGAP